MDILVCNAGITRDGLLATMKEEDWDQVMAVNLKGAFNCIKAGCRPMMKQRWGRIIIITSVVGFAGNAGQANYSASKAGLVGLTRSSARELASRGITVNCVAPGYIDTDMTSELPEAVKEKILSEIPLGLLGEPEDIAGAVTYLASDDATVRDRPDHTCQRRNVYGLISRMIRRRYMPGLSALQKALLRLVIRA